MIDDSPRDVAIGTYDPVAKPKVILINEERAMHWLKEGAQPSETTAYLLNKTGILEKFLAERPAKRKEFKFLISRRVPSVSEPAGRTETLASQRNEPSCIFPSQMPIQRTREWSAFA